MTAVCPETINWLPNTPRKFALSAYLRRTRDEPSSADFNVLLFRHMSQKRGTFEVEAVCPYCGH